MGVPFAEKSGNWGWLYCNGTLCAREKAAEWPLCDLQVCDGGEGSDALNGGAGNDTFITKYGEVNVIDGAAGSDTIDYSSLGTAHSIKVNLEDDGANTTVDISDTTNDDIIKNIENVTGTGLADSIYGNNLNNTVKGGAGNDTLEGGAGDDYLDGGDGTDSLYLKDYTKQQYESDFVANYQSWRIKNFDIYLWMSNRKFSFYIFTTK